VLSESFEIDDNRISCLLYAPVGDVPWSVTTLSQVIENQTSRAAVAARFLSSDANVEVLAISRISVQRVDELGSDGISLKNTGGAIKSDDVCLS
jgi:hypothetical protein